MSASVIGVRYSNSNAPASPMAFNLASNPTAGNILLCFVVTATGALTTFTLSDSVNGAWTNDLTAASMATVTLGCGAFRSQMATPITTAATLTLTSTRRPRNVIVVEVAGTVASPFDKSITQSGNVSPGSSQSASGPIGTTAALAQASEIGFCLWMTGFFGAGSMASNSGSGWTNIIGAGAPMAFGNATSGVGSMLDYIVVNATTGLIDSATGGQTLGTASYGGFIVTYKGTAAGASNSGFFRMFSKAHQQDGGFERRRGILVPKLWAPKRDIILPGPVAA